MMDALKSTLIELLGSKKALTLLATVIAAAAARLGWHVDAATLLPYEALVASYIIGQGIADHGKGAAEVHTAAPQAAAASLAKSELVPVKP